MYVCNYVYIYQNINESNSLVELIQHMDPDFEDEVNVIEHSKYYDEDEFKSMTEWYITDFKS